VRWGVTIQNMAETGILRWKDNRWWVKQAGGRLFRSAGVVCMVWDGGMWFKMGRWPYKMLGYRGIHGFWHGEYNRKWVKEGTGGGA